MNKDNNDIEKINSDVVDSAAEQTGEPETTATAAEETAPELELVQEPEQEYKKEKAEKKHRIKDYTSSSKFKHGGISTAFTAGFIVVIILINIIVGALGDKYPSMNIDLTKGSTNTLSQQALDVVAKVNVPTTIYILATEAQTNGDQILTEYGIKYSQVGLLAAKIAEKNSNIKVEYIDLDKNPTFATTYSADKIMVGDVIIKTEKRYRVLAYTDLFDVQYGQDGSANTYSTVDSALASGLNAAIADTVSVVAFDTGHGEQIDTTTYKKLLGNNSFDTKDVNLLTEEIPDQTQMIVLGCPTSDYTEAEIKKLDSFLSNTAFAHDRSLMITFFPDQAAMPNLATFLKEWGIEVPQAIVVETDQTKYYNDNASYILSNVQTALSLTGKSVDYGYFTTPQSNPINLLFESKGTKTTYSLAKSNDSTYLVDSNTKQDETPQKAAYNTAALSQDIVKSGDKDYKANVIALGSTLMFSSQIMSANTFGNAQYIIDLSKYATGTANEATAVTTTPVQTNVADITLSTATSYLLGLGVFTFLIPLLIAIAGFLVYRKRRHL